MDASLLCSRCFEIVRDALLEQFEKRGTEVLPALGEAVRQNLLALRLAVQRPAQKQKQDSG